MNRRSWFELAWVSRVLPIILCALTLAAGCSGSDERVSAEGTTAPDRTTSSDGGTTTSADESTTTSIEGTTSIESEGLTEYRDPRLGWSLAIPPGWGAEPYELPCRSVTLSGSLIVNQNVDVIRETAASGCEGNPDVDSLPPDVVLIEIERGTSSAAPPVEITSQTPVPLNPDEILAEPGGQWQSPRLSVDGEGNYTIRTWVGADVSDEDYQLARQVIESIRFN